MSFWAGKNELKKVRTNGRPESRLLTETKLSHMKFILVERPEALKVHAKWYAIHYYPSEWLWQNAIYRIQNRIYFYYKLIENKCPYDITWNTIQIERRENRFIYICVVLHFI